MLSVYLVFALEDFIMIHLNRVATDWSKIEKGVQGCLLSPCLFNLYAEHIMQNARLDKSRTRIKIARRNINNLRHADDTTLTVESEEKLHLMRDFT